MSDNGTDMKFKENSAEEPQPIVSTSKASGILKLDVDCLEELFEWLTLKDLQSLRQTSKRMKQVVNYHVKMNYPLRFGDFEFLDDVYDDLCRFDASFTKLYKSIKFCYTPLTSNVVDGLKHILSNVENVILADAQLDGTLYDDFLKFCTNLKSFIIMDFSTMVIDSEWLLQQYPTLESLTISDPEPFEEYSKLQTFLKQNRQLRTLSVTANIIADWMIESDVQLDELDIEMLYIPENDMTQFCNKLNTLHANGFYKKLHLYMYIQCEQHEMNEISTLRALEFLYIENITRGTVLSPLNQLKVFYMDSDRDVDNINMLVDNLQNVEKLHFKFADFESILPFFHRSTNLKEIKINSPTDGRYFSDGIIDLMALNKERKQCPGASKLIIYVKEEVYLNTKCAKMRTQYSLIELKRAESHIFDHEY